MPTTLKWKELAAAGGVLFVSGAIYGICEYRRSLLFMGRAQVGKSDRLFKLAVCLVMLYK
ncbi:MAG: hypothetical protein EXS30_01755 [Pedosphaera sp.]|nr:hypothetical protein [Pedosphaera sp.]